jgi:hypothetical protein
MEPWKTHIGNGNGSMFFFKEGMADGSILTTTYCAALNEQWTSGVPNIRDKMANSQGIFDNEAEMKPYFYKRIKNDVFRLDTAEYFFNVRIFYNSTLGQQQVMEYLVNDNMPVLLAHPNTIEMTALNGSDFLELFL